MVYRDYFYLVAGFGLIKIVKLIRADEFDKTDAFVCITMWPLVLLIGGALA